VFAGGRIGLVGGGVFTLLLVYAAYGDLRTRRISNPLVVLLAATGLAYSVVALPAAAGGLRAIEGFATGLACWLPFYVLGWLGAGDVKLFAAAGCWLGPLHTVEGALMAALVGAALAVVWMIVNQGWRRSMSTLSMAAALPSVLATPASPGRAVRTVPYGIALALGALGAAWMPGTLLH
jgi:prepilin peptidase CpaA